MEYKDISDKYGFDMVRLDNFFDIGKVEEKPVLTIRKKITEKVEMYAHILEELIQPDSSFSNFYEVNVLDDEDKKKILDTFKRMMVFVKESMICSLNYDEEKELSMIKEGLILWESVQKDISFVLEKIKSAWTNDTKDKIMQEYFG